MADEGRRQVVADPLAQRAGGQTPDRSFGTGGLRSPTGGANGAAGEAIRGFGAMGSIQQAIAQVAAAKQDEFITKGKMDFMTGVAEADMLRTGNKYTQRGYEALSSVDKASTWFQNELLAIDETTREMDPASYKKYLMDKRKDALANLPNDPEIRKVYAAAFEGYGPRLAEAQFNAHNGLNKTRNVNALSNAAYSSAGANEDASRVMPGGPLRVSPGVVSPRIETSAEDRDTGIRTMLGEAGGEGEVGMAAVAHVLKNRAIDGGYGGNSITAVARAPKQFSAWNNGPGGIPAIRSYDPNSKAYQRAARVYDAVMGGHNADMTNGATHYYSPRGMVALAKGGSQSHLTPSWWGAQAAKGEVTIGNHKFAGKARGIDNYGGYISDQGKTGDEYLGEVTKTAGFGPGGPHTNHQLEREYDGASGPRDSIEVAAVGPIPLAHTPGKSQVRETFDNSNLRDEDKAEAAADAMVRSLEEGNDQVYNDLGGEGFLRSLNATPQQINAVQAAKAKQVKGNQDKFNVDTERQIEDFKSAVKSGEFKTEEDLLTGVKLLQDNLGQDEAWAHSLANETLTEWHKQTEDDKALQPQLAADLAGIQRQLVEDPTYTAKQAADDAVKLGDKYDIDGKVVMGWVGNMYDRDATRKDKLITEMKTEKTKTDKENLVKDQVNSALKRNSGLQGIKGTVRVVKDGHEVEVDAQEYGVSLLKDQEIANAKILIDKGELDEQRAEAMINKNVYEKLAKHGVVDTVHGQEIEGALKGDFTTKDGKLSEDATKAFDFWLQMKKNPNVGPEYMAQMVKDPDVRVMLNAAELMYSGRLDIEGALRKAQLRISQGADMNARIGMNDKFQAQVGTGVDAAIDDAMYDPYFSFDAFNDQERAQVNNKRGAYREDVINRANGYHVQNPMVDPEVHIRMALEDFKNDSIVVGGNLVQGKYTEGKRLDQVMGVEAFGKDAPERAIDAYMHEFGKDLFGDVLKEPSTLGYVANLAFDTTIPGAAINAAAGFEQVNVFQTTPSYNIEYNATAGVIEVQLWKDADRKELIGSPKIIKADAIGEFWNASHRAAPMGMGVWRSTKEAISTGIDNSPAGRVPGDGGDGWTLGDLNPF